MALNIPLEICHNNRTPVRNGINARVVCAECGGAVRIPDNSPPECERCGRCDVLSIGEVRAGIRAHIEHAQFARGMARLGNPLHDIDRRDRGNRLYWSDYDMHRASVASLLRIRNGGAS